MRSLPPLNLSPRGKKIAKWVGYPVLALVSFVLALQLTFPYDRVKQRIIDTLAPKYDVTIASVGRGLMPGSVSFNKVVLTSRPKKVGDPVTTIVLDKVGVHVGLLALLGGRASIDYDVHIGKGSLSGNVALSKTNTSASVDIDKLSAEDVPGITDFVGLPMGGHIEGTASIELVGGDWRQAEMKIVLSCNSACTIGDGKAKIYPKPRPGQPQLDGVTVAKLFLTSWTAEFVIAKGKGDLKKFEVKSEDGELYVDLHVALQRGLMDSAVTAGCIKFKGSETLRKREEKFFNALNLTGAPLGPDGYHYVKMTGTLGNMRRLPLLCDLEGGATAGDAGMVETTGHIPSRPPTIRTDSPEPPPRPMPPQPQVAAPAQPQVAPSPQMAPQPQAQPPVPGDGGVPEPPPGAGMQPMRAIDSMPEGAPSPSAPPPPPPPQGVDNAPGAAAPGTGSGSAPIIVN